MSKDAWCWEKNKGVWITVGVALLAVLGMICKPWPPDERRGERRAAHRHAEKVEYVPAAGDRVSAKRSTRAFRTRKDFGVWLSLEDYDAAKYARASETLGEARVIDGGEHGEFLEARDGLWRVSFNDGAWWCLPGHIGKGDLLEPGMRAVVVRARKSPGAARALEVGEKVLIQKADSYGFTVTDGENEWRVKRGDISAE